MELNENIVFFVTLGVVSIGIIIAFIVSFSVLHNYNTNVKVETEKEKIEVSSHSNSNLKNELDMP